MDKCSYDRFEGMYNKTNGAVWFFGKCFNSIIEVVKIINDVPNEYDDYIDIQGLTCFVNTQTGQVWYNHKVHDNTQKACTYVKNLYEKGRGKTRIKRQTSSLDLEFMALDT